MGFFNKDVPDSIADAAHFGRLGTFGVVRELRLLPDMLLEGESVLAVTRGRVDATGWVMAVTDARILLVHRGLFFGVKHLEVPIDRIKSASFRTGLLSGAIFIDTGGGTVVLEGVDKKSTVEVSAVISKLINDPSGRSRDDDVADRLERLAALRDKGALTESEFLAQKRLVLGSGGRPEISVTRLGPPSRTPETAKPADAKTGPDREAAKTGPDREAAKTGAGREGPGRQQGASPKPSPRPRPASSETAGRAKPEAKG